jgi:hypothetical protein
MNLGMNGSTGWTVLRFDFRMMGTSSSLTRALVRSTIQFLLAMPALSGGFGSDIWIFFKESSRGVSVMAPPLVVGSLPNSFGMTNLAGCPSFSVNRRLASWDRLLGIAAVVVEGNPSFGRVNLGGVPELGLPKSLGKVNGLLLGEF